MSTIESANRPANQILTALPNEEYQRLAPYLEEVSLGLGDVLHEPFETVEQVYFPTDGLVSFVALMEDGSTAEAGLIGREGMVGLAAILGGKSTVNQALVQIAGNALRMDAGVLEAEFARGGALQRLLLLYTQALLAQVSQSAVCNALHTLEQRCARWLLSAQDSTEKEVLPLTQEFIAKMLGTHRPGVTEIAGKFSRIDLIQYSRGRITILNREGLESVSCNCYNIIKDEFNRLLGIERG